METAIKAPMPGLVARTVVNVNDKVSKGEEVVVLNVMKTEVSVKAHCDGVVKKVLVKEWDEVKVDDPLVILET